MVLWELDVVERGNYKLHCCIWLLVYGLDMACNDVYDMVAGFTNGATFICVE